MNAAFFKNKTVGAYLQMAATLCALIGSVAYLIFGAVSQTMFAVIPVLSFVGFVIGVTGFFYDGFFSDYLPALGTGTLMASLLFLIHDSIDDLTAFFVGMGNYFGNADNVGPRLFIAAFLLLAVLLSMISAFMAKRK